MPPTNIFDRFLLTLFATNVTPECHKCGTNQIDPLAAFLYPILKIAALPVITIVTAIVSCLPLNIARIILAAANRRRLTTSEHLSFSLYGSMTMSIQ